MTKEVVLTVALYAVETQTLTKARKNKLLEALEMWMWQRMLKISWKETVTKDEMFIFGKETNSTLK